MDDSFIYSLEKDLAVYGGFDLQVFNGRSHGNFWITLLLLGKFFFSYVTSKRVKKINNTKTVSTVLLGLTTIKADFSEG